MIEYQRDDRRRRLHWIAREAVTVNDVLQVIDRRAADGGWAFPVLYDARQRTGAITPEELRDVHRQITHHIRAHGPRGRLAVVVAAKADGMRRMYSMIGRTIDEGQRVFTDMRKADDWLARGRRVEGSTTPRSSAPPCPRCHSTYTVHTHDRTGERLFFCRACRQPWGLRPGAPTTESIPRCEACAGMLVPPQITGFAPPIGTDYVCLKCGRPYRWIGDPPRLMTLFVR